MPTDNDLIAGPAGVLDSGDDVCTAVYVYVYLPVARMLQALALQVQAEIRARAADETR